MKTNIGFLMQPRRQLQRLGGKWQAGKIGYILLWLLGVPIPVLFLFYLLRGCT